MKKVVDCLHSTKLCLTSSSFCLQLVIGSDYQVHNNIFCNNFLLDRVQLKVHKFSIDFNTESISYIFWINTVKLNSKIITVTPQNAKKRKNHNLASKMSFCCAHLKEKNHTGKKKKRAQSSYMTEAIQWYVFPQGKRTVDIYKCDTNLVIIHNTIFTFFSFHKITLQTFRKIIFSPKQSSNTGEAKSTKLIINLISSRVFKPLS